MAKNTNQTTDQTDKELDPKVVAKKLARADAKKRIIAFLKDNSEQLGSLKGDIEMFIGKGQSAARSAPRTVNSELRDAFIEKGSLSEMDIFKAFRIGRPEMVTKIRILVLCPNPADRVWVKFDEAAEVYSVVGTGAEAPEGWDGYIPSTKVAGL